MRTIRCTLVLGALLLTQIPPARALEQVDLLLALAMDVSRSMDQPKFLLQREGYAAAISNPQVLNAIKSGPSQKIAFCFIDWSGPGEQRLVIGWNVIDGVASAIRFGDLILKAERSFYNSTSIGSAINFAIAEIARSPFEAERHAIDVSGDGTNNSGRPVTEARDQAIARGVTINGLAIINDKPNLGYSAHTQPPGGLPLYYRQNVIGGPNAFLLVVEDFNSFADAMANKLAKEIDVAASAAEKQVSLLHPGELP